MAAVYTFAFIGVVAVFVALLAWFDPHFASVLAHYISLRARSLTVGRAAQRNTWRRG